MRCIKFYCHKGRRVLCEHRFRSWFKTRIIARVKICNFRCECNQAFIFAVEPDLQKGYPWIIQETLWQGFHFGTNKSWKIRDQQFRKAIVKYNPDKIFYQFNIVS